MGAFHQMGHDSRNLLFEPELGGFRGAILSPINYERPQIQGQIAEAREIGRGFEMIFDPQLYVPSVIRGCLPSWRSYYPEDVDTVDLTSEDWWERLINGLVGECLGLRPNAICSPAVIPQVFNDDYYGQSVHWGSQLADRIRSEEIDTYQTVIAHLGTLSVADVPMRIASIASQTKASGIYLIFLGDVEPRRELSDSDQLKGAMRLISELNSSGLPTIVGFSSSDMVLWKAAGATHCATGKFFNLRRFTRARFEEPSDAAGGGQLPYWFDERLMAFLRESDLIRVRRKQLKGNDGTTNPYADRIGKIIDAPPTPGLSRAWLALAWRQYMFAYSDLESRISNGSVDVNELLTSAERNWELLEEQHVLMEEGRNDGRWLRPWRRALLEFLDE